MTKKIKVSKKLNLSGTYSQIHNIFPKIQETCGELEKQIALKISKLKNIEFKFKEFEIDKEVISLNFYYEEIKEEKEKKKNGRNTKISNRRSNRVTKK